MRPDDVSSGDMGRGDEELIARLREALHPGRASPSPESLARLRDTVNAGFSRGAVAARRSRARLAVAASLFLGMSASMAGAMASGATLPAPLRAVARDVGLPVDSVQLAQTKTDADRLRRALERKDAAAIPRDVTALKSSFSGLKGSDRRNIDSEVDSLFDQAGPYDGHADEETESPASSTNPSASGTPGAIPPAPVNDGDGDGVSTSPSTTLAPGSDGGGNDGRSNTTIAGGSSPTTSTTAPSNSGDTASTPTTTDTSSGGDGSSGGGSGVQSDGGGN